MNIPIGLSIYVSDSDNTEIEVLNSLRDENTLFFCCDECMSCWKNREDLEKRINKFMEYSIKFDFIPATEEDIEEHKWEKYKLNIK